MPDTVVIQPGTKFNYERYPVVQLVTSVYAFRNSANGVWGTMIRTNYGTEASLEQFAKEIEEGHPVNGKLRILNASTLAGLLHHVFSKMPWFISVGLTNPGVDNGGEIILYTTQFNCIADGAHFGSGVNGVRFQQVKNDPSYFLVTDEGDDTYVLKVIQTERPIPAGA